MQKRDMIFDSGKNIDLSMVYTYRTPVMKLYTNIVIGSIDMWTVCKVSRVTWTIRESAPGVVGRIS